MVDQGLSPLSSNYKKVLVCLKEVLIYKVKLYSSKKSFRDGKAIDPSLDLCDRKGSYGILPELVKSHQYRYR
jgi:hypothetical protein